VVQILVAHFFYNIVISLLTCQFFHPLTDAPTLVELLGGGQS